MQAFYVKKEEKLSNDYHKINTGNQSNFYENVKDNEIKYFLTKVLNLFFQGIPDETVKNNQSKACPLSG
ncbi:TPA: hypothetical protein ACLWX9_001176 [Streptococcus pneumoniae]|uniref:Uncharacterized protein n=1 Tax=Streptococcus pneumoniae TaxID=1313 RepID=A0A0T8VS89_STREE|nr:hypothetical protein [Streptococcus pneumoniae]MBW7556445.1 hypothetical protein [Streptococcus pneumoniae]MBW8168055.1 hypothetical protein [Streptococcus pneumoniae]MDS3206368.1 hypothetical protein [Streptococcus pneumoniae]MDS3672524.1 hypothetical protein [Streptococcus pneumoniae]MDS4532581.1 hypothetical protein [Streptococcus pneumoniae]